MTLPPPTTNILPQNLFTITTTPSSSVLIPGITPAQYCPFVNINTSAQLAKFGLHNGGAQDEGLLNEKWEGLAIMPVDDEGGKEWWVLVVSDNDFVTEDGWVNGGKRQYSDPAAGAGGLLNMAVVVRVGIPEGVKPWG